MEVFSASPPHPGQLTSGLRAGLGFPPGWRCSVLLALPVRAHFEPTRLSRGRTPCKASSDRPCLPDGLPAPALSPVSLPRPGAELVSTRGSRRPGSAWAPGTGRRHPGSPLWIADASSQAGGGCARGLAALRLPHAQFSREAPAPPAPPKRGMRDPRKQREAVFPPILTFLGFWAGGVPCLRLEPKFSTFLSSQIPQPCSPRECCLPRV